MNKFQNILDDGEVSSDVLFNVVNKMGNINNLDVKSSNGSSFVFISSELNNVYQYFSNQNISLRIFNLISKLSINNIITKNTYNGIIIYNLFDYLSLFINYIPNNIIVWEKHLCLNSFSKEEISLIIEKNLIKILWDIGKALYGLHTYNIKHGDARIDNIGIKNNKFILFDFDGTTDDYDKQLSNNFDIYYKDIYDFKRSIQFNIGDNKYKKIKSLIPETNNSSDFINTLFKTYTNIENINININM